MSRTVGKVELLSRPSVLRFAAHCCTSLRDLVSKFQPARLQVCIHPCAQGKLHGMVVEESWRAHISKQVLLRPCTDSLLGFPGNALSRALLSLKHSDPTALELESWISAYDGTGTLVCTMSSTLMLTAMEESTGTSVLELEPPSIGAEPPTTRTVNVVLSTSSSKFQRSCLPLLFPHGVRQLGVRAKPIRQMGLPTKSQL